MAVAFYYLIFRRKLFLILQILFILSSLFIIIRYWNVKEEVYENKNCTVPHRNIVFLKTHKTAGSSIQNIFMRYADRNKLLLVLPLQGNYISQGVDFDSSQIPQLQDGFRYNIITHHTKYNYQQMSKTLGSGTIFVTILRDPVSVFESLYEYYGMEDLTNKSITEFAGTAVEEESLNFRAEDVIGRNQMSFDLGVGSECFEDEEKILRHARDLDEQFHLVMIAELMEESLILLKHELCLYIDDVVTLKHNARTEKFRRRLSDRVVSQLRKINRADQTLYNYFHKKFTEKLKRFGVRRMEREIQQLRQRTKDLFEKCIAEDPEVADSGSKTIDRPYSKKVKGFQLRSQVESKELCENLIKPELQFTQELREKQKQYLTVKDQLTLDLLELYYSVGPGLSAS